MNYPGAEFDARWLAAVAPEDYRNPQPADNYHLVVIGAGPAGLISAIGAAGLGAKVALVERHRMGGDCLNVGCVPSKALLEYTAHHPLADFDAAFTWLRKVRAEIAPHDSVARYNEAGVTVFLGEAKFTDGEHVVLSDGTRLHGRRFAICTGAHAAVPPIPGLRECAPLTNETVFDLKARPASFAILGAGAIGCELAQVFARLGVAVHLFELAPRVLPLEASEASAAVDAALRKAGVVLHLGAGVDEVRKAEGSDAQHVVRAGATSVVCEKVLVALGRRANTAELGLEHAGVAVSSRGLIEVDAKLRTSNRRIFAAGDCASTVQFTHHADAQARALIQNALFAPTAKVDRLVVPHCTYTQPEVASVGASVTQLEADEVAFDRYRIAFDELDRGRAEPFESGYAEVYTQKGTDKLLGATIVGPDAGEQIAPVCLLMSNGLGLAAADKAIFSYPTRSEYLKRLAGAYNRTRLTPTVAKLFRTWLRFTG